jgi:hypothetical protein
LPDADKGGAEEHKWNGQGHSADLLWINCKTFPVDRCTYD